jgi:RNA polymerase sigma-70 factor, ECF subfamily
MMERAHLMTQNLTERDLLAECRNGSREAMQALFVENQRRVFSVARNFFGGNDELAKDITQQVFLKLLTKLDVFRGDAEFTTWLYRITVNTCVDETRKLRRFLNFGDFFGGSEPRVNHGQDERIHSGEISSEVQGAIAELKPKFRLPILLKYTEGLSYAEIAEVLECSIGTVSSRLNRGHKMLAGKLEHLRNEI